MTEQTKENKVDNMEKWNLMARPPLKALKTIKGGRLAGMTNISPQWRWQIMTETFGMAGFGWKYTIEKTWTSPGANEEHFAFASILLYVKVGDKWSDAIPGEGGSKLISSEKGGLHNNDEAFKMAVTDAVGTAMSKLGVAADIYLGAFDGSKYNSPGIVTETRPDASGGHDDEAVSESRQSERLTLKQIRDYKTVKEVGGATGKKDSEVVAYISTLDKEGSYTLEELIQGLKGE